MKRLVGEFGFEPNKRRAVRLVPSCLSVPSFGACSHTIASFLLARPAGGSVACFGCGVSEQQRNSVASRSSRLINRIDRRTGRRRCCAPAAKAAWPWPATCATSASAPRRSPTMCVSESCFPFCVACWAWLWQSFVPASLVWLPFGLLRDRRLRRDHPRLLAESLDRSVISRTGRRLCAAFRGALGPPANGSGLSLRIAQWRSTLSHGGCKSPVGRRFRMLCSPFCCLCWHLGSLPYPVAHPCACWRAVAG